MIIRSVLAVLGLAALLGAGAVAQGAETLASADKPASWTASDFRGKSWSSADFADRKAVAMVFLGVDCPLAKLYAPVVQRLADEYAARGVAFVAVDSNRQDAVTEMGAFARQHKLELPFVKDLNNALADRFGVERTPEVVLLDARQQVRYQGRIDDQHTPGRSRPAPTSQDLRAALDDLLAGRPVAVRRTEAAGCLIGRVRAPKAGAEVTYARDIAPLLDAHCVECHRPGQIGPFSLTEYEETAGWAAMIAEVTRERRMPPWHASPEHGEFINTNRLTDREIQLIQDWSLAGAPAGDLAQRPPGPKFTEGWQLPREPDLVVAMASQPFTVPASGEVKYQYFSVDPQLKEDRWINAAEVVPGNPGVVHHVLVFAAPEGRVTDDDAQMITAYVPGIRVEPLPTGYAKKIPAGSRFVFQVHYTPNGSPQADLTKIGLQFVKDEDVTHEVRTASTRSRNFSIEPFKADQEFVSKPVTAPLDLQLLAMTPHMHLRGQSFRYDIRWPDGRTETLLDVPQYDFNWQTSYRLQQPIAVPKGAVLTAFAKYDNSKANLANPDPSQTVVWGDQSWEEMLIGYFDIAFPRSAEGTDEVGRLLRQGNARGEVLAQLVKRLDRNQDGQLQRSEVQGPRLVEAFEKLDENKDDVVTREELLRNLPKLRR